MTFWNRIGLAILVMAFGLSLYNRARHTSLATGNKKVITFCHWQLEGGWEEGLNHLFREYEKLHPDVKVQQIRISGHYYATWITTQLLGGTAPDIVELGREPPEYAPRYYLDLDPYIDDPNPYNKGTVLEGKPWRDTLVDGMLGGYRPQSLAHYGVPVSVLVFRVYYNRDLFKEILGHERPPADFEEWIGYCNAIRAWSEENQERDVIPIAAIGTWTSSILFGTYMVGTTAGLMEALDLNRNGCTGEAFSTTLGESVESFFALSTGRVDWDNRHFRTALDMIEEVSDHFQPGFVATKWEDGKFYFIQGRAAMMPTGTWETQSFLQAARFRMGAFRIPIPDKNHPKYGKYVAGPVSEVGSPGSGAFGIPRQTKHPEVAVDLLRFISSKRINEKLANEYTLWPPVVKHADVSETLKPFAASGEGLRGGFSATLGPETEAEFRRRMTLWLNGEIDQETFVKEYAAFYKEKALFDMRQHCLPPQRRNIEGMERLLDILQWSRKQDKEADPAKARKAAYAMESQLNMIYEASIQEYLTDQIEARLGGKG